MQSRFSLCWTRSRDDERSRVGHRPARTMEKTRPIADVVIKRYKERYAK